LIVCEGQTEYQFALSLKNTLSREQQRGIQIEISYSMNTSAEQVVNEARERVQQAKRDKNPYELVWLFFDHDNQPNLANAFTKIESYGFKTAYSAICIEHWFLLFFEDNRQAFRSSADVIRYLKQRYWPSYHKTKINHYDYLKNNLSIALERTKLIKQQLDDSQPIYQRNPYFTIDDYIDFFDSLRER
jgi:IS30 family transposase